MLDVRVIYYLFSIISMSVDRRICLEKQSEKFVADMTWKRIERNNESV